jgi:hypothetical protein
MYLGIQANGIPALSVVVMQTTRDFNYMNRWLIYLILWRNYSCVTMNGITDGKFDGMVLAYFKVQYRHKSEENCDRP